MARLVFVHSREREMANGMHDWANDSSGVKMKKTKVGRANETHRALDSVKVGGLANYISYTPWIENGAQVEDADGNRLTLQDKEEKEWRLPKGFLHNRPLPKGAIKDEDRSYWQSKTWKLNDGSTVFDLDTLDGRMGYYMCLGSSKIANSEREMREHKWPRAEYYIALQNESDEIKYKNNEIKSRAFSYLHDPNFVETYKRKFVTLLDLASSRSTLTSEQISNLLFNYIDKSSFTGVTNIDRFTELYNLLGTSFGREEIEARYILKQALDNRIIFEKGDTYTWVRSKGQVVIGDRYSEAVSYILNPAKAPEVEELNEMIKAKSI